MVRAVLLDIEGTTTPISFVHDVLFPYSRRNLSSYLQHHSASPDIIVDLERLREEHALDVVQGLGPPSLVEPYLYWLIEHDRKSPALKSLQGKIWKAGYEDGSLRAPVFPDVPPAMKRWGTEGKTVNIYSSGSVLAQKLLFANTDHGDLTKLISRYFDTQVGKKTEKKSYHEVAGALLVDTSEILFLSDMPLELDAAAAAGMNTRLCLRPGNRVPPDSGHTVIETFENI